jgi:hypothetical protein
MSGTTPEYAYRNWGNSLGQDNRSRCRDLDPEPSECEAGLLTTQPRSSVNCAVISKWVRQRKTSEPTILTDRTVDSALFLCGCIWNKELKAWTCVITSQRKWDELFKLAYSIHVPPSAAFASKKKHVDAYGDIILEEKSFQFERKLN